jgi:hypothetical protein
VENESSIESQGREKRSKVENNGRSQTYLHLNKRTQALILDSYTRIFNGARPPPVPFLTTPGILPSTRHGPDRQRTIGARSCHRYVLVLSLLGLLLPAGLGRVPLIGRHRQTTAMEGS